MPLRHSTRLMTLLLSAPQFLDDAYAQATSPATGSSTPVIASTAVAAGGGAVSGDGPVDGVLEEVSVTASKISTASEATLLEGVHSLPNSISIVSGTGTDGGKNSSLGVLDITNTKPTFNRDAEVSLTLGTSGTVKGQAAAGGAIIDGLLAWRGSFYTDKQKGRYPNVYNQDASYLNTDRTGGRMQLLLTPAAGLSILLADYYQPSSHEYVNGLAFNEPTPATYANGAPVNVANLASTKLGRSWFTQEGNYSLADYYDSVVNNDAGGPVVFNTQGRSATINWQAGRYLLTSITSYNAYTQEAQNDDGTPFDISKQGGYILDFHQFSQELRLSASLGNLLDYRVGLYYLTTQLLAYNRSDYGSDAGAYYANAAQYAALDANANGQLLMQDALDRLNVVDRGQYGYDSRAAFAHLTWRFSDPFNLVTGFRLTREYRSDQERKGIHDDGFGTDLNPASVNNVALGGFSIGSSGALTPGANSVNQLELADQLANKYFGATVTGTPGAAYNSLTAAQKTQVADAEAVRLAQISGLYLPTRAQPFEQTIPTWELSPTFKFAGDEELANLLWQRGEKPGISQIVPGANAESYLPRRLYGQYLRDVLHTARAEAPPGVQLEPLHGETTAIHSLSAAGPLIVSVGTRQLLVDQVVLACGHPAPVRRPYAEELGEHPAYVRDPYSDSSSWPASDRAMLLIGTGLTMADVAVAAAERNPKLTMVALSRHGLLPRSQPLSTPSVAPAWLRVDDLAGLRLRQLLPAVRGIVRGMQQQGVDWREVIGRIRPIAPQLWRSLDAADRRRFLRHVRVFWDVHRHRLPPATADRIVQLQREGRLQIRAGCVTQLCAAHRGIVALWRPRGRYDTQELWVDRVVECSGSDQRLERTSDPLWRQLLGEGIATPDNAGMGLRTGPHGALINIHGQPSDRLFYLGPMLRAEQWEATAVGELRAHAQALSIALSGANGKYAERHMHMARAAGELTELSRGRH